MGESLYRSQIINVGLRLATLVTKVGLMLYMSRFLSLTDMGTYGLVFGAVMIASDALGLRFDYVVSRDLVGASPEAAVCKMRDQLVFYGLNYLVLFVVGAGTLELVNGSLALEHHTYPILALAIVECYAGSVHSNIVSLGRPLLANVLFFIRAALWVIIAIALGLTHEMFRTVNTIFLCWFLGVVTSLITAFYFWRHLPWHVLRHTSINWAWIRAGVHKTWPIWLGTVGATAGAYVDRFVVEKFLGLDYAGVLTFYFSFAAAIQTLILSGVLSFAYPRLISLHQEGDEEGFWKEFHKAAKQVALWATFLVACMAVGVPLLGWLSQKPLLMEQEPTLLLLLTGAWIRAMADTVYYVLFARHQDRAIWQGNLLYLVPAILSNVLLIPLFGFVGTGYAFIIANLFLFLWRWSHAKFPAGWHKTA